MYMYRVNLILISTRLAREERRAQAKEREAPVHGGAILCDIEAELVARARAAEGAL